MPPPMVVCSICRQNVMKAQTYHVGDGKRACKDHEGIAEKKAELERQALQAKGREKKLAEERVAKRDASTDLVRNRCWACRRVAITEQEFWTKMLVAHERMKLKHIDVNPFAPEYLEHVRKEMNIKEKFLITSAFPAKGNEDLVKKLPLDARSAASFAGVVSLCQDCAANVGFKKDIPKASIDQLIKISAGYEVLVRPIVIKAAKEELKEEVERN